MLLPEKDRTRLISLLGMMGSTYDNEVLSAAKAAQRLVKSSGLTWEEVMAVVKPAMDEALTSAYHRGYEAGRDYKPPTWNALAHELLDDNATDLTTWEEEFLGSFLQRGYGTPTDRQKSVFSRIADKCGLRTPGDGPAEPQLDL
jgi:hypothetical protein